MGGARVEEPAAAWMRWAVEQMLRNKENRKVRDDPSLFIPK